MGAGRGGGWGKGRDGVGGDWGPVVCAASDADEQGGAAYAQHPMRMSRLGCRARSGRSRLGRWIW
eukprot:195775-Chlamydomonas_euryale.AAC.1